MDGIIFLVVFRLMMMAVEPTCGQMIKYSTDCKDQTLGDPELVVCPNEEFQVNCSSNAIVVATVCFGFDKAVSFERGSCNHSSGACLDDYSSSDSSSFIELLKECLWTNHACDFAVKDDTFKREILGKERCMPRFDMTPYQFIAVYNRQCIDGNTVLDICNSNASTAHIPEVGYVHSPGFPSRVFGNRTCSQVFRTHEAKDFEFLIQHVHLDEKKGDHVTISAIMADGSKGQSKAWYGFLDTYENFTLGVAHGFLVEYQQDTNGINGFLFSYQVFDAPPMATNKSPTNSSTSPTNSPTPVVLPKCGESQPCGARTLTNNNFGLILALTWCAFMTNGRYI